MNQAFAGADNLVYKATDAPDLSGVTDMSWMFGYSDSFDGNIEYWDVSGVTNMYAMFAGAESFNHPLNYWDVSKVTNMASMFAETDSFNQDLDRWDVSSVTSMDAMFERRRRLQRQHRILGRLGSHRHGLHVRRRRLLQPGP